MLKKDRMINGGCPNIFCLGSLPSTICILALGGPRRWEPQRQRHSPSRCTFLSSGFLTQSYSRLTLAAERATALAGNVVGTKSPEHGRCQLALTAECTKTYPKWPQRATPNHGNFKNLSKVKTGRKRLLFSKKLKMFWNFPGTNILKCLSVV